MKKVWLIGLLLGIILSNSINCSTPQPLILTSAFYYWKGTFYMDGNDEAFFLKHNVKKLYIKFFDVVLEGNNPVPAGTIYFDAAIPENFSAIVPVVFITNETILATDSAQLYQLAQNISKRISKEVARTHSEKRVSELQIDCDWTAGSRDRYFYLLSVLKENTPYSLSTTIRLHQYKYHKNNIPPVKRGLLMCYNVNDPASFETGNSIFTYDEVMKYITDVKYPLELDLALPLFDWGVRFNAQEKFLGFISGEELTRIESDTSFVTTQNPNVFKCIHTISTYNNYYEGEYVRMERVNIPDVLKIKKYLQTRLKNDSPTISLFNYDKEHINELKDEEMEKLLETRP